MTQERLADIERWLDSGHVQLDHALELFGEVDRLRDVLAEIARGPHPSDEAEARELVGSMRTMAREAAK